MRWLTFTVLLLVVFSACTTQESLSAPGTESPTLVEEAQESVEPTETVEADSAPTEETLTEDEQPPSGAREQFSTDFSKHSVPYSEILSGGPPKDGIPSIDNPKFVSVEEADSWLSAEEPVVLFQLGDDVRAYPIQILMWHEIVNDVVNDTPVAVTFCPLCNTAIAFEARIDGMDLTFGTTGRLRYSNLIMYDRQTETWWQQATGEAIAGKFTGRQLGCVPATLIAWQDFVANYPDGKVLSRETGYSRSYGSNPYRGYDDVNSSPFLYAGPDTPDALPPMARVLTVELNEDAVAYPYEVMQDVHVANDSVGGKPILVVWMSGTASPLDSPRTAGGRDVGTVAAYARELENQTLTFRYEDGRIVDEGTGSEWDVLGQAVSGPRAGQQLEPVVGVNHFWFSWAAFKPETRIYRPEGTGKPDAAEPKPAETVTVDNLSTDVQIRAYQGQDRLGGEKVFLSDLLAQGKPVVLHLWAGLCPICRGEMPNVQAVYESYQDEILLVGLDMGSFTGLGNEEDAQTLMDELGITFPTGTTPDATVMRAYEVLGVPASLFFAPDGTLVNEWTGPLSEAQFTKLLDELLDTAS